MKNYRYAGNEPSRITNDSVRISNRFHKIILPNTVIQINTIKIRYKYNTISKISQYKINNSVYLNGSVTIEVRAKK